MKKLINKNTILGLIVGIIISGITVYATQYLATDISFAPKNTNWKKEDGSNIANVKDALDYLYANKSDELTFVKQDSITGTKQQIEQRVLR